MVFKILWFLVKMKTIEKKKNYWLNIFQNGQQQGKSNNALKSDEYQALDIKNSTHAKKDFALSVINT